MRTLHMHAHAHTLLCCAGLWVSVHVCQLDRKEVWWEDWGVAWSQHCYLLIW